MNKLLISSSFTAWIFAMPVAAQSEKFMTEFSIWYGVSSAAAAFVNCQNFDPNDYVVKLKMDQQNVKTDYNRLSKLQEIFLPSIRRELEELGLEKWCQIMWDRYGSQGTEMPHFLAIRPPTPGKKNGLSR